MLEALLAMALGVYVGGIPLAWLFMGCRMIDTKKQRVVEVPKVVIALAWPVLLGLAWMTGGQSDD